MGTESCGPSAPRTQVVLGKPASPFRCSARVSIHGDGCHSYEIGGGQGQGGLVGGGNSSASTQTPPGNRYAQEKTGFHVESGTIRLSQEGPLCVHRVPLWGPTSSRSEDRDVSTRKPGREREPFSFEPRCWLVGALLTSRPESGEKVHPWFFCAPRLGFPGLVFSSPPP